MKRLVLFSLFFTALFLTSEVFAATPNYSICRRNSNGALSVRTKCKSNETRLSNFSLLKGEQGIPGPAGENATGKAYAFINANGTLETGTSRGGISVVKLGTGSYCVTASGIDRNAVHPVVTADYSQGSGVFNLAMLRTSNSGCTTGWLITTRTISGGLPTDLDIAFSFFVP